MKVSYRGHEITVNREPSLGGDVLTYWSIFRESDGYCCEDTFYEGEEHPDEFVEILKERIDNELAEDDPWMESEGLAALLERGEG